MERWSASPPFAHLYIYIYIYIGEKGEGFGQKIGELEGNMLGTQEN
jgi:hypothetical protein